MADYIIGDIHGSYDKLVEMWKKIKFNKEFDKVIFLGDYIDRGSKSYEVVKFIQKKQKQFGKNKIIALMGNHEDMAIKFIEKNGRDFLDYGNSFENGMMNLYYMNGGGATITSYKAHNAVLNDDLKWFKSLPLYYESDCYIAVHAGLNPKVELKEQNSQDLLWIREEFHKAKEGTWNKTIVFGHSITFTHFQTEGIAVVNGNFAIDTGAVAGGFLTALKISDDNADVIYVG